MTKHDSVLSGEARLRARHRVFLRYLAIAFIAAMIAGLFSGYAVASFENGDIPLWVPVIAGIATLGALTWFTRDYFRRIDELDLMDNLWAHMTGLYAGIFLFGGWYLFADLGLVAPPSAIGVVSAMLAFTAVAYGLRKLGLR